MQHNFKEKNLQKIKIEQLTKKIQLVKIANNWKGLWITVLQTLTRIEQNKSTLKSNKVSNLLFICPELVF